MSDIMKVFTNRRVAVTLLLGFSSGLPLALTSGTLQAWMATEKIDIKTIGWLSLVGLPYTWKFLWSPLFDRFSTNKFLGPRRGWILILQVLLVVSLLFLGTLDPLTELSLMAVAAVVVAFLSASQDIVIDAYRTEVLRPEERGAGASAVVVGARMALLLSGAGALIMADRSPWQVVYWTMAGFMGIGILGTLWGPEPEERIIHPTSLMDAVINPFIDFFKRKGAIAMLFFVILYKFGDAFSVSLATPFLMSVGFTKTEIGTVFKGVGMFATILGAVAGGGIIARIGLIRSLWVFGILQAVSNFGFMAIAYAGNSFPLLVGVISFDNICGGLGNAAFVAFLMSLCNVRFTATQYALLTSVMAIARVTVGVPAGYAVDAFGWPMFFLVSVLVAIPGLIMLHQFAPWGAKDPDYHHG